MSNNIEPTITKDEIKKEFQLERMILFSDAVFAIVITLMAIEIKIPETNEKLQGSLLNHELLRLLPFFGAYIVSFFFIGTIWYQHLKIFSLVKDYDKGLVVRNLLLLFFVGLFPFCASIITRSKGAVIAFVLYLGVILCCFVSQYFLQHYILVKRPALRINASMEENLVELKRKKVIVICFALGFILFIAMQFVPDPDVKAFSPFIIVMVAVFLRFFKSRKVKPPTS